MDRKKSFTKTQVEQIKKLIAEKLRATPVKQKGIRAKIRKVGFHYFDFSTAKDGYTVADFEALIRSGAIQVIGDNNQSTISPTVSKTVSKATSKLSDKTTASPHHKKSFAPIVSDYTEILILGTMPGDRSLKVGEYYAHSGNRFWKIIASITNDEVPTTYEDKQNLLSRHKIGLWDVAQAVTRDGSLDSNISSTVPIDLDKFLKEHNKIRVIGLNGGKAVDLFDKFFDRQPNIVYHNLSSTSGANTGITFQQSCNEWKRIFE